MSRIISIVTLSMFAVSVFAQNTTTSKENETNIQNTNSTTTMLSERNQWAGKVADELANLPEDIQKKCQEAKNRADELGRQIQALKVDSLTTEQQKSAIKELIAAKKAEADARISAAMENIEAFKTEHKAEIEAAHVQVRARIEAKKEELKAKRAEIEKKIAEKNAEINDPVEKDTQE